MKRAKRRHVQTVSVTLPRLRFSKDGRPHIMVITRSGRGHVRTYLDGRLLRRAP